MMNEDLVAVQNRCYCLFDCECKKVERLISDWTSIEALETVKRRLLNLADPTEIFARFACVLFYRQILDGSVVNCTKDNLRKTTIAFSFAASFTNEEIDCFSFYASCWQRFQELALSLNEHLSHIRSRRLMPLMHFIEEVFPLESDEPNFAPSLKSEATSDQNANSASDGSLEGVHSQLDHSVPEQVQSLHSRQIENRVSRARTRSMPSESANKRAVKRSVSKEEEKKPKKEIPVATNGVESDEKKVTKPKEESEEVVEPCDTLNATATQPCQNVQTQTSKRSENREKRVGEPMRKRVRFASLNTHSHQQTNSAQTQNRNSGQATDAVLKNASDSVANAETNVVDNNNWFKCPLANCELKFKFEWMVERHMKLHKRHKTFYDCPECGMDFTHLKSRQHHAKLHSNRKRFICKICDFRYRAAAQLLHHQNKYHGDTLSQSTS